jgi:hypothetical protein
MSKTPQTGLSVTTSAVPASRMLTGAEYHHLATVHPRRKVRQYLNMDGCVNQPIHPIHRGSLAR